MAVAVPPLARIAATISSSRGGDDGDAVSDGRHRRARRSAVYGGDQRLDRLGLGGVQPGQTVESADRQELLEAALEAKQQRTVADRQHDLVRRRF